MEHRPLLNVIYKGKAINNLSIGYENSPPNVWRTVCIDSIKRLYKSM